MPRALLIPVAIHEASGRHISAGLALGGKDCGYVCPECRQPVVAKLGARRRAHFAHLQEGNCAATEESLVHRMAKAAIEENGFVWLPAIELESERTGKGFSQGRARWSFDRVHVEPRIPVAGGAGIIGPDILVDAAGRQLAIEVTYRHPTDGDKVGQYRALGLACMEIVVKGLGNDTPYEDLKRMLRDDVLPSGWLFNRKIDAFLRQDEVEWKAIEENRERERKRKDAIQIEEGLKRIRQHEREQTESWEAMRALKKAVRDNAKPIPVVWREALGTTGAAPQVASCPKSGRKAVGGTPANVELDCRRCEAFGGTAPAFTARYDTVYCAGGYLNSLDLRQLIKARATTWAMGMTSPPPP